MNENNEWGNISLPGLSDEKLFNKNWNKVAAGLENKNNVKLLKLAKQKKGNVLLIFLNLIGFTSNLMIWIVGL